MIMNYMRGKLLIVCVLAVQFLTTGLGAYPCFSLSRCEQDHSKDLIPLTKEEFEDLLKGPTPDNAIAIEIPNRGVLFDVNEDALAHFRTFRRLDIRKRQDQRTIEEALNDAMSLGVERLKVFLFNYGGECSEYQKQFEKLAFVIDSKVTLIPQLLDSDKDHHYEYVQNLHLETRGIDLKGLSNKELQNYWTSLHALQLLTGVCSVADKELRVSSRVILGGLHGPFPVNLPIPDIVVKTESFTDTRDIFSVLILFSLAEEARKRDFGRDIAIACLGKALELIKEVEPSVTTKAIEDGIDGVLEDLKSQNPVNTSPKRNSR